MNDYLLLSIDQNMLIGLCVFIGVFSAVLVVCTAASLFQTLILTLGVEKLKLPDPKGVSNGQS